MTRHHASPRSRAIRRVHDASAAAGEVIFVDVRGLPVVPLTAWYRLRGSRGPDTTRQTYASMLMPVLMDLAERGIAWNAPPDRLMLASSCTPACAQAPIT
jgi:hypothetical protein